MVHAPPPKMAQQIITAKRLAIAPQSTLQRWEARYISPQSVAQQEKQFQPPPVAISPSAPGGADRLRYYQKLYGRTSILDIAKAADTSPLVRTTDVAISKQHDYVFGGRIPELGIWDCSGILAQIFVDMKLSGLQYNASPKYATTTGIFKWLLASGAPTKQMDFTTINANQISIFCTIFLDNRATLGIEAGEGKAANHIVIVTIDPVTKQRVVCESSSGGSVGPKKRPLEQWLELYRHDHRFNYFISDITANVLNTVEIAVPVAPITVARAFAMHGGVKALLQKSMKEGWTITGGSKAKPVTVNPAAKTLEVSNNPAAGGFAHVCGAAAAALHGLQDIDFDNFVLLDIAAKQKHVNALHDAFANAIKVVTGKNAAPFAVTIDPTLAGRRPIANQPIDARDKAGKPYRLGNTHVAPDLTRHDTESAALTGVVRDQWHTLPADMQKKFITPDALANRVRAQFFQSRARRADAEINNGLRVASIQAGGTCAP